MIEHNLLRNLLSRLTLCLGLLIATSTFAQNELRVDSVFGEIGQNGVGLDIELTHDILGPENGLAGFSFGLLSDATQLIPVSLEHTLALIVPDFVATDAGTTFLTIGVAYSITQPFEVLPPGSYSVARATYIVAPFATAGFTEVELGAANQPPVVPIFSPGAIVPTLVDGGVQVVEPAPVGTIASAVWLPSAGDELVHVIESGSAVANPVGFPGGLDPRDVAIGRNGVAWVAYSGSSGVGRFLSNATPTGALIPLGSSPTGICLDPEGNAWVTDAIDGTVAKIAASGAVLLGPGGGLGAAIPVGAAPRGLTSDRLGNIWVAVTGEDQLVKLDPTGAIATFIDFPPGSEPTGVAIDRLGFLWVTLRGTDRVERRGSDGSFAEGFDLTVGSAPEGIAIRGATEAWVAADLPVKLAPGALPDPIDDPGTPDPTAIAVSGLGDIWIVDATGNATRFDAAGGFIETVIVGTDSAFLGDATGLVQANILHPNLDFDGDGFGNQVEIDAGTDPFDDASLPQEVPPILDLLCLTSGSTVNLTWENAATYDAITIERNGVVITNPPLAGTTTSFSDPGQTSGLHTYSIQASRAPFPDLSGPVTCQVLVGQGGVISVNPIGVGDRATNLFDVAARPGALPGGPRFYATDSGSGKIYALDAGYFVLAIIDSPFGGNVPSTGIAFDPDGNGGAGSLFVASGGDAADPARIAEISLGGVVLEPAVGGAGIFLLNNAAGPILGRIGGLSISSGSSPIVGIQPNGELIFRVEAGAPQVDYQIPHPSPGFGLSGLTHLGPETATETSMVVTEFDPVTEEFSLGQYVISFDGVTAQIAPASIQISLIPLQENENAFGGLAFAGEEFSIVGSTTSVIYEIAGARPFIRGDANLDGGTNLADAITILELLFIGGPDFGCLDAFDTNDDGANNIADAIYLLDYLFIQGPPLPPPSCDSGPCQNADPTPDGLGCI